MKYNVCLARKYKAAGQERIHFWNVGKAYEFQTKGGVNGINIKLYSRTLMTDEFVLFEDIENENKTESSNIAPAIAEDDIPF